MIKRIFRRIVLYLRSCIPSEGETRFVEVNRAFWKRYWIHSPEQPPARYVLVEASDSPIIRLCNASFGAIVCHARHVRPIYLLHGLRDRSAQRILESYHPESSFIYTTSLRYLLARFLALFLALRVWLKLRKPRDILEFRVDGIKFGDIIYDNTLVRGYATLKVVDLKVLAVLRDFFMHRYIVNDIIKRYRLDSFVVAHTIGMFGGTFSRYLLKQGVEVINRVGSHDIHLQKYRSLTDVGFYPAKPERQHFEHMMSLPEDVVIPLADSYLDERHNQHVRHIAVEKAFNRSKRMFGDRNEFCRSTGLDPNKRTVFVMLHVFNDHPHSHFARPLAFQDYYDWFERTLQIAQTVDSVNWVFKEHPAADLYTVKDVDLHAMFARVSKSNIVFLDAGADFNALSIRFLADVIVTCLGTAGMEYACIGIPCLLGGESPYSGFGFTIEPENVEAYDAYLRRLDQLERLTSEQIKAAKIVMYFELPMMHSVRYLFCPLYDYRQAAASTHHGVLSDAAELMATTDLAARLDQIEVFSDFLRKPNCIQFIDLDGYPFMRNSVLQSGLVSNASLH
ncbi:MAG: hypothetical protein JW384_00396 [Nitrosomonadaceae bacterium]|nr:hypothetical protein [Nitrosomonadaceae bacterium]